jgi:hypothetical protein
MCGFEPRFLPASKNLEFVKGDIMKIKSNVKAGRTQWGV